MTTEGWICPLCHAGVAPSCVRCPCAEQQVLPRLGKSSIGLMRLGDVREPTAFSASPPRYDFNWPSGQVIKDGSWDHIKLVTDELRKMNDRGLRHSSDQVPE
jgi:hypothetical protein